MGCSRFARHYSGNRFFFLFLRLLRCFSSPAYLHCAYGFSAGYLRFRAGGFPHSEIPGSTLVQQLPEAYRSHPRPSSALGAKASTVCPCSLDLNRTVFRKKTPLTAMQFSRYARASARHARVSPVEAHCLDEVGPPADPGDVRRGLVSQSSTARRLLELHRRVTMARRQAAKVSTLFPGEPDDAAFIARRRERSRTGCPALHRGTACGG